MFSRNIELFTADCTLIYVPEMLNRTIYYDK